MRSETRLRHKNTWINFFDYFWVYCATMIVNSNALFNYHKMLDVTRVCCSQTLLLELFPQCSVQMCQSPTYFAYLPSDDTVLSNLLTWEVMVWQAKIPGVNFFKFSSLLYFIFLLGVDWWSWVGWVNTAVRFLCGTSLTSTASLSSGYLK